MAQPERDQPDTEFLRWAKSEVAAMPHIPTLEEVQAIMSKIPGSLADAFDAERDERCSIRE